MSHNNDETTFPTQAFLHGEGDIPGDCWRTAIAGLLGMERDDVPHFAHLYPEEGLGWWNATVEFVEHVKPGWTLGCASPTFPVYPGQPHAPAHVIASGPSPRFPDTLHAVIVSAETGDLVWDPHPDRTGLAGEPVEIAALETKVAS